MNKINDLVTFEKSGIFSFGAITQKTALKKSRLTKEVTPNNLQTIYKLAFMSVSLGNDYQQAVNNRLEQEGKTANFKSKSTYTEPFEDSKIVLKHKHKEQFYLRVYPNLCTSFWTRKEYFDAEGNHIPYKKWKRIEREYFSLPSENKSQNLDNEIIVNNYKIENVKWVKRGSIRIEKIKLDDFKQMFDKENIDPNKLVG